MTLLAQMPESARQVVDDHHSAALNMATDEMMLERADQFGELICRFYQWEPASVSLGYFQSHADRASHEASRPCPWVRRASGGGAIVHDGPRHDLTYAIVVPRFPRHQGTQLELYQLFHESMVEILRDHGVEARQCQRADEDPFGVTSGRGKPFLCFQRHAVGDVLVGQHKVLGSAQRRFGSAILQHGSLLLQQSDFAPELPGVRELAPRSFTPSWTDLVEAWRARINDSLTTNWCQATFTDEEKVRAQAIVDRKFGQDAWNQRR